VDSERSSQSHLARQPAIEGFLLLSLLPKK
jgi:hypothetical protein